MHHYNRKPIEIGRLQRFAMESFYAQGASIPTRGAAERKEKIACIGAGPASLACAAELRQQGFQVTVFERRALPGGLNTYGVAEYKLRTEDSLREIEMICALGVELRGTDISDEAAVAELEREFDCIFLGVGLGAMHPLDLPGADHPGIVDALEFIASYKRGEPLLGLERVAVIGAGNTAIDAAVAAKRLGATQVKILYRRDARNISAFGFEFERAKQEGVEFLWCTVPTAVSVDANGRLRALICARTELNDAGELLGTEDVEFALPCDLVIPAIGQSPLIEFLSKVRGLKIERGRVVVDRATGSTSNAKYFAGGDCVNGGREVVDAVADGKRAALGIVTYLDTSSSPAGKAVAHG
jgi:glutamate synthase (NADPH/NADH) small chain